MKRAIEIFKEVYAEWRWQTYLNVDMVILDMEIEKPGTWQNPHLFNVTPEVIKNYKQKNFAVSESQIKDYEKRQNDQFLHAKNTFGFYPRRPYQRPIFIENCFIDVSLYNKEDLLKKIRENIICFNWWDVFTYEEFKRALIEYYFLKSTIKLVTKKKIEEYLSITFNTKDDIVNQIFINFQPSVSGFTWLSPFDEPDAISFDYDYLFGKDLLRSIRIIENECRLFFHEKIIGAFYNETILFREMYRIFGTKYKVISQGSPDWLRPQRFDIYFPELQIAIEYQGDQHYIPIDFGGMGNKYAKKQFKENLERDKIKKEKADTNNCLIIYADPDYSIDEIVTQINTIIEKKIVQEISDISRQYFYNISTK